MALPLPLAVASEKPTDADIGAHVLGSLRSCVEAFAEVRGVAAACKILIHLEAAVFDRPDLTPALSAIAQFLEDGS